MERSNINGQEYRLSEVVRIKDPKQYKLYVKHEVYPIDMYTTKDEYTGDDILIMLFERNEKTRDLYMKWKNHELR